MNEPVPPEKQSSDAAIPKAAAPRPDSAPAPKNPAFAKFSNAEEMHRIGSAPEKTDLPAPSRNDGSIQRIRTFKSDIAEAMNRQNASLVSMAAAEQERRAGAALSDNTPAKKKFAAKKFFSALAAILLIVSGVGVVGYLLFFTERNAVTIAPEVPSLIFADAKKEVDASSKTPLALRQSLAVEREGITLSLGDIAQLYLTTADETTGGVALLSSSEFLTAIDADVGASFVRTLAPEFMLGVHVFDGNQPFIIFRTNSYENAFAGMLSWESTLNQDLAPFFGPVLGPNYQAVPGSASSTATTTGQIPVTRVFEDLVIQNIDTRVLRDDSGNIMLLYAFPNQQTLIITTNEQTLVEIISRFQSTRVF